MLQKKRKITNMAQQVVKFGNRIAATVTVKVATTSKGKHSIYVFIHTLQKINMLCIN